jgi:hypothetical protein
MDDIERGQEREQADRALAIAAALNRPSLPAVGRCHNCDARVPRGAHFCDVDCRVDYERAQAAQRRNGRAGQGASQ